MLILGSDQGLRIIRIKNDLYEHNIFERDVYFTIRLRLENNYDQNLQN
jgi:hypothetical protein